MSDLSTLCTACHAIFAAGAGDKESEFRPHHQTPRSFFQGLFGGCYVCTQVWHRASDFRRHLLVYSRYQFHQYKETDSLTLLIRFSQEISGDWSFDDNDFEFTLIPTDNPVCQNFTSVDDLGDSTSSLQALTRARSWLSECHGSGRHVACECIERTLRARSCPEQSIPDGQWRPTRLLDIGEKHGSPWKLSIASENDRTTCTYISLSYRWGSANHVRLLHENIERYSTETSLEELPPLFIDTIKVAQFFSVRYLWIDSLCIIQDSASDWETESAQMARIYTNSLLTIAASVSPDPDHGLFRWRSHSALKPGLILTSPPQSSPPATSKSYYIDSAHYTTTHLTTTPLNTRAWVFQERYLSPRLLHFTTSQLFWECFTRTHCEIYPANIPFDHSIPRSRSYYFNWMVSALEREKMMKALPGLSSEECLERDVVDRTLLWGLFVREYSKCELTFGKDKLPALSGLARVFDGEGDVYFAGVWQSDRVFGLCWETEYETKPPLSSSSFGKSPSVYRAPTWSWASVDTSVFPWMGTQYWFDVRGFAMCYPEKAAGNLYGAVEGGEVEIAGMALAGVVGGTDSSGDGRWKVFRDGERVVRMEVRYDGLAPRVSEVHRAIVVVMSSLHGELRRAGLWGIMLCPDFEREGAFKRFASWRVGGAEDIRALGFRTDEEGKFHPDGSLPYAILTIT